MVGRTEEALVHLREAIALNADLRKLAEEDSDLEAIRGDSRFASAVAGEPNASGPGS
jgi:hypothetical protein